MSIEKKSLISTLKTTKKANAASSAPEASQVISKRSVSKRAVSKRAVSKRAVSKRAVSKRAISKRLMVD
ncbi:MAG TPA: hypothetical protein VGR58_12180 [Candidatus Acidoferrum sp.]|nr:hypothetical protein [Candidatus Acidoferrum sp.]